MGKRALWIWCRVAYWLYLRLPIGRRKSRYDRFCLWLLGYAGAYAYSDDYNDFRKNAFQADTALTTPTQK